MSTLDLGKVKQLWRGTWNNTGSYLPNDIVAYNGAIWICTQGHAAGASTEFSPGKRDRANVLPVTVDPSVINTFTVTVQPVNNIPSFFIDGRQYPSLTLYSNMRYRFYQKDISNLNHRLALSTTPDGIFGSGGVELPTSGAYTYAYSGTPGIDGALDFIPNSLIPGTTLYYFSETDTNYGGGANLVPPVITISPGWRGWQYWDQITTGATFQGSWSNVVQYRYNDIVEYQGATYIALADNFNAAPGTFPVGSTSNSYWLLMVNGDRRSEHNSVAHFMNKGPLGWAYPHGNLGNGNQISAVKWISRSGRVYNHGGGYSYNGGLNFQEANGTSQSFAQEITFNHSDWWTSRDNGGPGRLVTPDGQPPKCIQIESGFTWNHYLFNNGEVWSSGNNAVGGYLGSGDVQTGYSLPRRVAGLNDVKIVKISAGYGPLADSHHVLALDDQGYVWVWGRNTSGQLGLGHTTDEYTPQRLPRAYFNNERVIDIIAMGSDNGCSYARTAGNNLYGWGHNGAGNLGTADTTNRYRPTQFAGWSVAVAATNGGIQKWQAVNVNAAGNYASFMILDGNGYLWQAGYDGVGAGGFAATSASRSTLTKSTALPGGTISNFWSLWSGDTAANAVTFIRANTGITWVCGQGANGNNTQGTTGNTTGITGPTALPTTIGAGAGLYQIAEVYMHVSLGSATFNRTIHWLTDSGKVFAQGYNAYGQFGAPWAAVNANASASATDESGSTTYPVLVYLPSSTKVKQILPSGGGSITNATINMQHGMFYITDTGQVFGSGMSRTLNSAGGNNNANNRYTEGSFIGYSPIVGEQVAVNIPVSIQYAR